MQSFKSLVVVLMMVASSTLAWGPVPGGIPVPTPGDAHYARRCVRHGASRWNFQGTLLWGTRPSWTERSSTDGGGTVLISANLDAVPFSAGEHRSLEVEAGHLAGKGVVGSVLRGVSGNGQETEVAICDAQPSPEHPEMVWYRIQAWNPVAQDWENPCVATGEFPDPRAVVLSGSWDATGAHQAGGRRITFACEAGVLAKCAAWGYRPWASAGGQSLADAHQACTRMARADYCGNGRAHTESGTLIDYYDRFGVAKLTTSASPRWNPEKALFEGEWGPDGATCLARTRDGRALEEILAECPDRFRQDVLDLGEGDRCVVQRAQPGEGLLRNRHMPRPSGPMASN